MGRQVEQIPGSTGDAPAAAATQQDGGLAAPDVSGFRARGRMRRRARFLRRARELAYRDLGGLVFNLHRFGQRNDQLVLAKLGVLGQIDGELRALQTALGERDPTTVLREAGVTACPRCAAIHAGEDRYCPNCGLSLERHPDLPIAVTPGAAVESAPATLGTSAAPAPSPPSAASAPLGTSAASAALPPSAALAPFGGRAAPAPSPPSASPPAPADAAPAPPTPGPATPDQSLPTPTSAPATTSDPALPRPPATSAPPPRPQAPETEPVPASRGRAPAPPTKAGEPSDAAQDTQILRPPSGRS